MEGSKERKMNCGLVTAYQVREGGKGLKQKLLQKESAKKIFHHTSLPNITLRMKGLPGIK
jgi:hypothetical protein